MAKMLTDELLAQLLIEAWRDGYKECIKTSFWTNPESQIAEDQLEFMEDRMQQIIDKAAVK